MGSVLAVALFFFAMSFSSLDLWLLSTKSMTASTGKGNAIFDLHDEWPGMAAIFPTLAGLPAWA
jgi:hypothetical protein